MRNERGSILVLTLIVFAVLMVLGTFTLGLSATENKQALNHQYKTQAYYIARAGAEAVETAILGMDDEEIDALIDKLNTDIVSVGEISIKTDEGDVGHAYVSLSLDSGNKDLVISSLGKINAKTGKEVRNTLTKVMGNKTTNLLGLDLDFAIFAVADNIDKKDYAIDVGSGATVKEGDVGTNGSIRLKTNGKYKCGTDEDPALKLVDIMDDSNITVTGPGNPKNNEDLIGDFISKLVRRNDIKKYNLYEFSKEIVFDDFSQELSIANNSSEILSSDTIKTNKGNYKKIDVGKESILTIDTSDGDIELNIKEFIIRKGGIVKIKGNNKATINVWSMKWSKDSSIEYENENDSSLVDIYHYGDGKMDWYENEGYEGWNDEDWNLEEGESIPPRDKEGINLSNSVTVKMNLYIKEAKLHLRNSSRFEGNIFSNGESVRFHKQKSGSGQGQGSNKKTGEFKGFLYAPNAHIETAKDVEIRGAVICNSIRLGQKTKIIYNENYVDKEYINNCIGVILSSTSKYTTGYYK